MPTIFIGYLGAHKMAGIYLVTTPIGNIQDITYRAKQLIESSQYIYCEDTRVFKKLAKLLAIDVSAKYINSYHDHSSQLKLDNLVELAHDHDCLFLSDAGSPIISDPAFPLIQLALEKDVSIFSVSGISSIIAALELSALAPIPFHFHGFLARDKSKKNKDFEMLGNIYGTHIFFEGVSRVIATIEEICALYPEFDFAVARELTKEFETVYRFKGSEFQNIKNSIVEKGEFVILIHNPQKQSNQVNDKLISLAREIIDGGARPKPLSKLLAMITGDNGKDIYKKLNISK